MPRTASDYTEAIRSLLDETNGSITHGQARPRLEGLGFDIVPKPKHKSSSLSAVDEYEYDEKAVSAALRDNDMKTVKTVLAPVFESTGYDDAEQKAVIDELRVRLAFYDERNFFDVTKFNWSETAKSAKPSVSRKPAGTKNSRAKAVTKTSSAPPPKHKRRGRKPAVTSAVATTVVQPNSDELAALELIEKFGGVSDVEARIAELREEIGSLEGAIELVAQLTKRSDELQKRLRSAA